MIKTDGVGKCDSCGADIMWREDQNGVTHPLNYRRVRVYHEDGCYMEVGHLHVYDNADEGAKPLLMRISHFLTCPNAKEHSKS